MAGSKQNYQDKMAFLGTNNCRSYGKQKISGNGSHMQGMRSTVSTWGLPNITR